jgi:hypothetical protein
VKHVHAGDWPVDALRVGLLQLANAIETDAKYGRSIDAQRAKYFEEQLQQLTHRAAEICAELEQ